MNRSELWQGVLLATRILWIHSEREPFWPYVNEIVEFLRKDMTFNLHVTSWVQPMLYIMNDAADPTKDLPKLLDFIESRLTDWEDNSLVKAYADHLKFLLEQYHKKID